MEQRRPACTGVQPLRCAEWVFLGDTRPGIIRDATESALGLAPDQSHARCLDVTLSEWSTALSSVWLFVVVNHGRQKNCVPASDLQSVPEEDVGRLRPAREAGYGWCAEVAAVLVHCRR